MREEPLQAQQTGAAGMEAEDGPAGRSAQAVRRVQVKTGVEIMRDQDEAGVLHATVDREVVCPSGGQATFLIPHQGIEGQIGEPLLDIDHFAHPLWIVSICDGGLGRRPARGWGTDRPAKVDQVRPIVHIFIGPL